METSSSPPPRVAGSRRPRKVALALGAIGILAVAALVLRGEFERHSTARVARRALEARRYSEADAVATRLLKDRPGWGEAHFLKGWAAFGLERPQEAYDELGRARELGYGGLDLDRIDAILRARAGRHAEAEPVLRQILDTSEAPDPEVAEALARVYLETYQFQQAVPVIERWIRDDPGAAKPYLWRTEINTRLDKDPDARIRDYRAALDRDPDLDKARLGVADELRQAGRAEKAAAEYETYIARKPDDPAGHRGAGLLALDRADDATAITHLDRALALDPRDAAALSARAAIAVRQGQEAEALALLDRAVEVNPHDLEIRHRRSLSLARLGRTDEARAEQDVAARLREDGRKLNALQEALVKSPTHPGLQAQVARWMFEHGHEDEGVRWANKILKERPADPEANRLLAEYYERTGNVGLSNFYRLQARPADPPK